MTTKDFKLWFGKHKGKNFKSVPTNYLEWLVKYCDCLGFTQRKRIGEYLIESQSKEEEITEARLIKSWNMEEPIDGIDLDMRQTSLTEFGYKIIKK